MTDDGYQGGTSPGGKWGCAAAAIIGGPIGFLLLIADAIGDCIPDHPCPKGFLTNVALTTVLIALLVGFGVRAAVNRRRSGER